MRPQTAASTMAALSLVVMLAAPWMLGSAEFRLRDLRLALRVEEPWPGDLVLIRIDDETIRVGGRWPWPRGKQGELLRRLRAAGARTILYDFFFRPVPPTDAQLEQDMQLADSLDGVTLVAPMWSSSSAGGTVAALPRVESPSGTPAFRPQGLLFPDRRFAERVAGIAHTHVTPASDGRVRSYRPFVRIEGVPGALPSLAVDGYVRQRGWTLDEVRWRTDALVFPGGATVSLHDGELPLALSPPLPKAHSAAVILDAATDLPALVKDRMVLLYSDYQASADRHHTALSRTTPGGWLHAYAIRALATGRVPSAVPARPVIAVLGVLASLATLRIATRSSGYALSLAATAAIAYGALSVVLVRAADVFLPVASPLLLITTAGLFWVFARARGLEVEHKQLRSLLDALPPPSPAVADERTAGVVADPVVALVGGMELPAPVRVGRYLVEKSLARGGMGAIFLARDLDLERVVALKVLETASPDAFQRFRREALSIARVTHPNVVQVYEVGFDSRVPYIVMEYVAGGAVLQLLAEAPHGAPWERVLPILADAAKGLGAAHAAGIVHRDVKPSNLLLVHPGADSCKVADFGIAKLGGGDALTSQGSFIGTIGYLPPEQAVGGAVDARSDVFSLGVSAFRLLTGRMPFSGTIPEVLRATLEKRVPDPGELRPELPVEVRELVLTLTDPVPDRRPADGNAAAAAIEKAFRLRSA